MNPALSVRVHRIADEAQDIRSFELVDPRGAALPPFSAGAHIDVHLPNGLVRQYSLCNDPRETHRYLIGVLREAGGRGGSAALHDAVRQGDALPIGLPRNHFPLSHDARRSLLLAGGIGITPLLSMAERLSATGAEFELHYAVRSRARAAFLDRIAAAPFAQRVRLHVDDGPPEQRLRLEALIDAQAQGDTHLYVCGPNGFIDATLGAARKAGWAESRLHVEFFGAPPPGPATGDRPFELRIASTGRVVPVAAGQSAAEALRQAGIDIPLSCEQGICGTCVVGVLDGEPEHRDLFMTAEEHARNDCFTPCCSRARTACLTLAL
jgi:vanillate O-demethylase ferredoxin subunit